MRTELEQIKKVEDYLLGNLTDTERVQIEKLAQNDLEFAQEIEWQKIVMDRISKIAIKNEISAAHKRYMKRFRFSFKNKVFRNYFISVALTTGLIIGAVFVFMNKIKENTPVEKIEISKDLIKYKQSEIITEDGALLKFEPDVFIIISPEALTENNGNPVYGSATIKFRQFKKDENDCIEINAFRNNVPLKLKNDKALEIIFKPNNTNIQIENHKKTNTTNSWTIDLSGQTINGKILPKLLSGIHIENPGNDSLALQKRDILITALNKLDSLNSILNSKPPCIENSENAELNELARKRIIVLLNSQNREDIKKIIKIHPDNKSLLSNSEQIELLYNNYLNSCLKNLNLDFRFYKVIKINQLGLWTIKE